MSGFGEALSRARKQQGLSLQQVSEAIHITPNYLEALEVERLDEFPADVYARGFLRSYSSFLNLDPEPLLEEFNAIRRPTTAEPTSARRRTRPAPRAQTPSSRQSTPPPPPAAGQPASPPSPPAAGRPASPSFGDASSPSHSYRSPKFSTRTRSYNSLGGEPRRSGMLSWILFVGIVSAAYLGYRGHLFARVQALLHHETSVPIKQPKPAPVQKPPPPQPHPVVPLDQGLSLTLQATGWVHCEVTTDVGKDKDRHWSGEMVPGEHQTWKGRKQISVYADRGNNLVASLNGKDMGRLTTQRRKVWASFPPAPPTSTEPTTAAVPSNTSGNTLGGGALPGRNLTNGSPSGSAVSVTGQKPTAVAH